MLLIFHVIVALAGIGLSTYAYISPAAGKIRLAYGAVLLTIASGTVMTVIDHLSILSVCLSGLLYVGFTVSGLVAAQRKLARQERTID